MRRDFDTLLMAAVIGIVVTAIVCAAMFAQAAMTP